MKHIYFLAAAVFCTTISAQNQISFEAFEGYQLGDLRDQNSWTVTDNGAGNFIQNQMVSDDRSSVGTYSFKNAYEPQLNPTSFPIIGAQKSFSSALVFADATVSFDVFITEIDESNFEMAGYGIGQSQEFVPVFDIAFDYTGSLFVITSEDFDLVDTGATWVPNQWYNVKVKVSTTEIKYYIDDALIYTTPNFSQLDLLGLNFLHDNFGGDAYIDNINATYATVSVSSVNKGRMAVYPNPVKNNLNFSLPNGEKISHISIHNIVGHRFLNKDTSNATIDLEKLQAGIYFVTVTNASGTSYSSKFIKE